jgi:ATP-binding cassette, subfamily G (WHITE), member 2
MHHADTLVDSLSVREMLLYTAELKRPMGEPLAAKRAAVEVLLGKLALTGCK